MVDLLVVAVEILVEVVIFHSYLEVGQPEAAGVPTKIADSIHRMALYTPWRKFGAGLLRCYGNRVQWDS